MSQRAKAAEEWRRMCKVGRLEITDQLVADSEEMRHASWRTTMGGSKFGGETDAYGLLVRLSCLQVLTKPQSSYLAIVRSTWEECSFGCGISSIIGMRAT
jgi:hypothetical protein